MTLFSYFMYIGLMWAYSYTKRRVLLKFEQSKSVSTVNNQSARQKSLVTIMRSNKIFNRAD